MPQSRATYVACTKCMQVSLSETCKYVHPSCMKTCNAFALLIFVQLGCTQYETHKFLHTHMQRKHVALAQNLHGACTEHAHKLVKFFTKLHTLIFWHLSKKIHSHQISTDTQNSQENTQHKTSPNPPACLIPPLLLLSMPSTTLLMMMKSRQSQRR
jgi:hypothetical protein